MISRLLLSLLAVVLGAYAIFLAADPLRLHQHMQYFQEHGVTVLGRSLVAGMGVILLSIVPAQILVWSLARRYAKTVRYRVGSDQVTVSLQAVEEALSRALEIDPAVRTATVRILANRWRRRIEVACALVLYEDTDVSVADSRCQQLLRARFKEVMSGAKRVSFHLHVNQLRSRASDPGQARLAPAPSSDEVVVAKPAVPLPGLTATGGATSKEAAAALLAGRDAAAKPANEVLKSSQSVTEVEPEYDDEPVAPSAQTPAAADITVTPAPGDVAAQDTDGNTADEYVPAAESEAMAEANDLDDSSDLPTNLYAGPSYPVGGGYDDEEDEDEAGSSRS